MGDKSVAQLPLSVVLLADFSALLGPVRRIMTEASPMYALTEDCVPLQQYVSILSIDLIQAPGLLLI
jgi:hypothetical protein